MNYRMAIITLLLCGVAYAGNGRYVHKYGGWMPNNHWDQPANKYEGYKPMPRRPHVPDTYEGRIAGHANKAIEFTAGMENQLQCFAWMFTDYINEDMEISDVDKRILITRPVMARFYGCYQDEGQVLHDLVVAVLENARTTKATIKLGRDAYEFIEAFASNNGLDPNDVMAEAVTEWYRVQEARMRHEAQLKKSEDTTPRTPSIPSDEAITNSINER